MAISTRPRTVSRRKMKRLRIQANAMYRRRRLPSVWNRLPLEIKINSCIFLTAAGSSHKMPCGDNWSATGMCNRYVMRQRKTK